MALALLVWAVGAVAFLALGTASGAVQSFDPGRVSLSLGSLGNVLAAPAVRWDSVWYLQIAHDGYRSAIEARFFPLYPLLIRAVSLLTGSMVVAGVLISLVALFIGLEVIRRLTELELGRLPAQATVRLIAFGPMALFLSAIYSESLFIALSAATFYAARRGRWAWAGVLGGLAGMTRIGGFLLVVPVLLLFYYGPRQRAPAGAVAVDAALSHHPGDPVGSPHSRCGRPSADVHDAAWLGSVGDPARPREVLWPRARAAQRHRLGRHGGCLAPADTPALGIPARHLFGSGGPAVRGVDGWLPCAHRSLPQAPDRVWPLCRSRLRASSSPRLRSAIRCADSIATRACGFPSSCGSEPGP